MDEIIIEGIRFQARCGVTLEERQRPQPLLADVSFACSARDAAQSDDLAHTVDYAHVVQRVIDVGEANATALVERMADEIAHVLLAEFPVARVTIWLRKAAPPLADVTGSVGVRLTYPRPHARATGPTVVTDTESTAAAKSTTDTESTAAPSPFLTANAHLIPNGRVLDVAAGRGRHALYLASHGYEVVGLDRDAAALDVLTRTARERHLSTLTTQTVDLEIDPANPPSLGEQAYDGIVVTFYLFRPLFPAILHALKPGGVLIYETFLIDNHLRFHHPRNTAFCLAHNELLGLINPLRVLCYEEGPQPSASPDDAVITARLVAQRTA